MHIPDWAFGQPKHLNECVPPVLSWGNDSSVAGVPAGMGTAAGRERGEGGGEAHRHKDSGESEE